MTYADRIEITKRYNDKMPLIERQFNINKRFNISPYSIMDWSLVLTPIEFDAWQTIRGLGVPFYPQFTVLNYFLDFANPGLKIGLECDGKQWHDKEKDTARDLELLKHGWKIFRITGAECHRTPRQMWEIEDEQREYEVDLCDEINEYYMHTSVGVIESIWVYYFLENRDHRNISYMYKSLYDHRNVFFNI